MNETQDAAPKEEGGALARQPPAPTQHELLCVVTAVQERLAESMGVQTVDDLCAVIAKRYPDLLSTPFCATSCAASPDTDDAHAYPHSSAAMVCDLATDTEVADGTRQG